MPDGAATAAMPIHPAIGRKTNIRWLIVAMLFAVTTVNNAVRATISIAGPVISKDLGLNAAQMGVVFSAVGWAYVVAQLPGGRLLDRYGSKMVYMARSSAWCW
jgi:ACS family glucarate transporter-like MFS transporter